MEEKYKFKLETLPYNYDALKPYLSEATLKFHHDKHHQTYLDNLNKARENYPKYQNMSLEELIININSLPAELKNQVEKHGGGVYNHNIYFKGLTSKKTKIKGELEKAINRDFGSFENFKEQFKKSALAVFGSGWAWLVKDENGKLMVVATANQICPLSYGLIPIVTIDVWEHAYYIDYQNRRGEYIDKYFEIINWDVASENYNK